MDQLDSALCRLPTNEWFHGLFQARDALKLVYSGVKLNRSRFCLGIPKVNVGTTGLR